MGKHKSFLVVCCSKIFCLTVYIRETNGKCVQLHACDTPGSSPKDKTDSKLSNCYGNADSDHLRRSFESPPRWFGLPLCPSTCPSPPIPPYPPAPLSSFFTISPSLSLPFLLSVGGLQEKVVHFWIRCSFEVQPSFLLSYLSLSSVFPLICSPPLLSPGLSSSPAPPVPLPCSTSSPYQTSSPRFLQLFFSQSPFFIFLCCLLFPLIQ